MPVQLAPVLRVVLHAIKQPPQFAMVLVSVSQPFVFGAAMLQSAKPGRQPV